MPRRIRAAVLAATALLAAGCAGQPARPAAAPACQQPPDAVLPRTVGSLTEEESGSYCLAVGEQLSVFLTVTDLVTDRVTAQQDRWTPVTSSDPKVLTAVSGSTLTAPIGVTPGLFRGLAAGTVRLTSRDGGGRAWQATVVVR